MPGVQSFHTIERAGRTSGGVEFRTSICAPRSVTPPHLHARPFVCVILDGVSEQTAGGVERQREPGRAFFYPAGEVHHERFGPRGGRIFSMDLIDDGLRLPANSSELGGSPAVLSRRAHVESVKTDDIGEITIESAAFALTAELSREIPGDPRWIASARDYLHTHFAGKMSLRAIAAAAGVHPVHLCRSFPRRYGMTIGDYLRALRVDYAARELMATKRPIAEIAFDAGFASQSHMTRHFRSSLGIAPAAYRAAC